MNKLLLIIVFFVATAATKLLAQEKGAIEIKGIKEQSFRTIKNDDVINQDQNQFEIVANENVDVNLKISLKNEGNINVLVTDKKDKVVFSKKNPKRR